MTKKSYDESCLAHLDKGHVKCYHTCTLELVAASVHLLYISIFSSEPLGQ